MIDSILDNDLYKFTMQQAVHALYPRAEVQYEFINRGETEFPEDFHIRLQHQLEKMADLKLRSDELRYLKETCYFLTPVYLDFLSHYRFSPENVAIEQSGGDLKIHISGPWYTTILWEVPLLAIISELYFTMVIPKTLPREEGRILNVQKSEQLKNAAVDFSEFGTRRRFSAKNQGLVIKDILSVENNTMIGTSNVHWARQFGIKPIGTHAHEWFMFHAAEHGYKRANRAAIDAWSSVFRGHLGIALTDTYTTDLFLHSFDSVEARLFDGVRQDSGDPYVFVDKLIAHYKKLRINPLTKTIVFSDDLDVNNAISLKEYCEGKINTSFGIGTNLSNDIGSKPLNMVIKLSQCRSRTEAEWVPMIKLSDTEGKHTGDVDEIALCLRIVKRSPS
jgi:nicotinate phosphoribosyltransferase